MKSPGSHPTLKHFALSILGFLFLSTASFAVDTVVFPVPTPPAGSNPDTFPAPRNEWFVKFQSNLDATKGHHYDLLFEGDSITDFWQTKGKEVWDRHFGQLNPVDFGISGDRTENVLW